MRRRELLQAMVASGVLARAYPGRAVPTARVIVSKMALIDGRAVLALKIHDAGPYLFMIDTGGHLSLIDDALAKSLQLRRTGLTNAVGVGGAAALPLYLAQDVVFGGGAVQPTVAFAGIGRGFTGEVRGALAAGMLTAVDSDLDFEKGEWRAYPDGRPERIGFLRMSNAISGGGHGDSPRLFGNAEIDGRKLRVLIDTGAPRGLSLQIGVARSLGLWSDTRPFTPQQTFGIGGIGGIGRLVRAQRATFGGRSFDRPLVLLRAKNDGGGGPDVDGVIGLDLLQQFNFSTEPKARALWVRPNALPAPAERYGMSGLWLEPAPSGARVAVVGTGSPAAAAGLRAGDTLLGNTAVDLIRKLSGKPGDAVSLTAVRGGRELPITFTLTPYL